ncbi:MAG: pseudouridine synthase [Bacteroidales bacterium]|nr:pseudouridine synthase [Bacteroidales bacterium]
MEDNKFGGNHRPEGRSDYGHRSERVYSSSRPYHRSSESGDSQREHSRERERRPRFNNNGNSERKPFYSTSGSDRPRYNSQDGERRPFGERPRYVSQSGERRSFGDRPRFNSQDGERRTFGERPRYVSQNGERKPYGERPRYNSQDGERRPYGERPRYNSQDGERRPYGDRPRYNSQDGERRPYGDRPRYNSQGHRQQGGFRKKFVRRDEDSGIYRMLSRKPLLDAQAQFSDNDMAHTEIKDTVRLNKFIANSGMCSRREADNFIQAGVVTVNGEVVTELGVKVNPAVDDVRFNGERLKGEEKVYIVMNKPKGFVTTASDPHADKTVMDLLKGCSARVFPVGRLDKNTTGVLMFTNDGEIAEKLTHPSYNKKKIYQVTLDNKLSQEDFDKILTGVTLQDGEIAADDLEYIDDNDHRKLGIEIHSGKNRIVRRIFESLGYEVKALDRVYFAGLTKKNIKKGEWRYLTEGEANILKMGAYV